MHIYNDGDPSAYGEAEFYFDVYRGDLTSPDFIESFHLPTQDIDDWGETDRPYAVGFAHVGNLEVVDPKATNIAIDGRGVEDDWPDSPEVAWGHADLGLPSGKGVEKVTNAAFRLDAPVVTVDSDFRFGVDVRWSVEYDV